MKIFTSGLSSLLLFCFSLSAFAQIPVYVPVNGLKVWIPFSGNGNDLSPYANHAVNNGATFIADRFGNPNEAADFNGSSQYMIVNTPSFALNADSSFTFSVWVNKQTQSSSGVVMMIGSNTAGNFIANIQGQNAEQFGTNKQQSAWFWASAPHSLNAWDHYVGTYDSQVMSFYKNGVYQSGNTFTHTGTTSAILPLNIGRGLSANYYNGAIDDMGIWNRALSAQEINDLYTGTLTGLSHAFSKENPVLYPNPATDRIIIPGFDDNLPHTCLIYDASFRMVKQLRLLNGQKELEINDLEGGMYFVIPDNRKNSMYRFIKY